MGRLVRAHDWSLSPLGQPSTWPQSLKTALSICLGSKFPMVIWWGHDLCVFYNDAYIPIPGPLKHPMFLGRPAQEQWPEIWDVVGAQAKHVLATGEATWSEDQPLFMTRSGFVEERYFTFSFSPAREESGAVGGMFCAVQEMTARVINERRLRVLRELGAEAPESVERVAASATQVIGKSANDAPFVLVYLTSSTGATASLAGSAGVVRASSIAPEVIALTTSAAHWPLARVNETRRPERVDGLRARFPAELPRIPYDELPDSAYVIPIELAGHAVPFGFLVLGINPRLQFDDAYQGFFSLICKQITSHVFTVRALAEEKQRTEALAEMDRAKTAFFSNVSHEFRTPLTLMLGPIEQMLEGRLGELTPELRVETEVVQRNALRLLKLVNALLDFSRIEAGRVEARYEPMDLAAATKDLVSGFRAAIEQAGMQLVIDVAPLPAPVYVDRDMWEKIVLNLLSNAFKYTLQGEIRVSLAVVGKAVELAVADTGTGIAEQDLSRVFERFHRVEAAVGRTYEGTGIGLALVRELAKLHGGSICATSTVGEGSTFTVALPLGSAHLPQDRILTGRTSVQPPDGRPAAFLEEALRWLPDPTAVVAVQPREPGPRKRVLVADDNADMRDYVRRLLAQRYDVTVANDGQEALALTRRHRPDLVISDIMMPVMDGLAFLEALRADPALQTTPVILLSARAGEEARASGIETGADDYLTKPFSAKELMARVRTQLHMAEIRRAAAEKDVVVAHLAQQQRWLESVLDLVPTPLLLMEPDTGRMKFANQAAHRMAGGSFPMDVPVADYAATFTITNEKGTALPWEDIPAARASRGEEVRDAEVVWRTSAGNFSLLVDSERVPALDGAPSRVILCLRDVTRLKKTQAELERLIDARDDFLSVASHELKTPLTSIQLQTESVRRSIARGDAAAFSPAKVERLIDVTDRQVSRLTRLVDDLLDVSRIETGKLALHPEEVDLAALVTDVVYRIGPTILRSGSTVTTALDRAVGRVDRFRIEQVLINLLTNASRYGGGKPIEIALRLAPNGGAAVLSVTDRGTGIEKGDQERIFSRFERAVSSSEAPGLGLGLYIAREIVEAHRGSVVVESERGAGARFIVTLPLAGVAS